MVSTSELKSAADPLRAWRSVCALGLVLCPVSYLSLVVLRFAPLPGALAAVGIALFLAVVAASAQGYRRRVSGWEAAMALAGAGAAVGGVSYTVGGVGQAGAAFVSIVTALQMASVWIFLPWLTCDLAGTEYEPRASAAPKHRAPASPRSSLSFVIFTSFVLFGLGALWSRGELWAPSPTPWLGALTLLALGAMLLERLSFFTRSAREGNLSLPHRALQRWVSAALLTFLLAGLFSGLGPFRPANPAATERTGRAVAEQPFSPPPSISQPEQQLAAAAAAAADLASSLRNLPPSALPLLLLVLLLLLAVVLVWLFQRSRAATWLLWAVGWLISRAIAAWHRLLAIFQRSLAPAKLPVLEAPPPPAWVKDPLFDVFEHPDVLAGLTPREIVIRTYHLLLSFGEMLGRGRRHSETPLEYADSLRADAGPEQAALRELTWGYVGVMYGDAPAPAPNTVRDAWGRLAATLTAHLPAEELALRRGAYLRRPSS